MQENSDVKMIVLYKSAIYFDIQTQLQFSCLMLAPLKYFLNSVDVKYFSSSHLIRNDSLV